MKSSRGGSTDSQACDYASALGRCLVDGDLESAFGARIQRRRTFGVSLTVQLALVALLVVTPLLSVAKTQLKPSLSPPMAFFGEWRAAHQPASAASTTTPIHTPVIPNPYAQISHPIAPPAPAHSEATDEGPFLDVFPVPGIRIAHPPGSGDAMFIDPPHIDPPLAQPLKRPLKMSEGVLQAQLISRIEPRYPVLAMETKTQGTVSLHAIISRDGRITSLDVISGHPLLVPAALEAVRQWRYRPTMLNGEPVEVETSITVIFRLGAQ